MSRVDNILAWALDDDDWEDTAHDRILLVLIGGLLMRMGFRFWASFEPTSTASVIATMGSFAGAVILIQFAVSGLALEKWGRWLTAGLVLLFVVLVGAAIVDGYFPQLGTDAALFSRYSVDLVLASQNPYTQSMAPATRLYEGYAHHFSTPRIDGGNVATLSYPAGSVLAFVPQRAVFGGAIRWTTLSAVGLIGLWFAATATPQAAVGLFAGLVIARNLFVTAAGGVFDVIWILPVLIGMYLWYQDRWMAASAVLGIAAATKQTPWAIAPFLAVWVWKASDGMIDFIERAGIYALAATASFVAINAPFLVDSPRAWVAGVLTPVAGGVPLVHQGVGMATLTYSGLVPLATSWHTLAVLAMVITLLTAYWLYFEALQWTAWCLPMLIYFVHYRSLMSYFVAFLPLSVYALVLARDEVEPIRPAAVVAEVRQRVGQGVSG